MSPSAKARLARDAGAVGPVRSLGDGRAERPEVAAAGQEPVGAAGGGGAAAAAGSFCSCSSTERGRDTPELGKWEEGSGVGGGQRERRREDRRPRLLTRLASLARRRLTRPPAAGRADYEGERRAQRERHREGSPVALSVTCATADEARSSWERAKSPKKRCR